MIINLSGTVDEIIEFGKILDKAYNGTLEDRCRTLSRAGRKIDAIKVYRQATGASLKDAKDFVESLTF